MSKEKLYKMNLQNFAEGEDDDENVNDDVKEGDEEKPWEKLQTQVDDLTEKMKALLEGKKEPTKNEVTQIPVPPPAQTKVEEVTKPIPKRSIFDILMNGK